MDDELLRDLRELGFEPVAASRRGGLQLVREHNRFLTFTLHSFEGGELVLTWSVELGEFCLERGLQIGAGETSFQELYPSHDVRVPAEAGAVAAEVGRALGHLRFDLGDPDL